MVYQGTKQGELELVLKPAAAFYEAKDVLSGIPRWEAVKASDVSPGPGSIRDGELPSSVRRASFEAF